MSNDGGQRARSVAYSVGPVQDVPDGFGFGILYEGSAGIEFIAQNCGGAGGCD